MRTRFKSGIIKSDISNHFPIFFFYKYIVGKKDAKKGFIYLFIFIYKFRFIYKQQEHLS